MVGIPLGPKCEELGWLQASSPRTQQVGRGVAVGGGRAGCSPGSGSTAEEPKDADSHEQAAAGRVLGGGLLLAPQRSEPGEGFLNCFI